jgi:hypothetical protein
MNFWIKNTSGKQDAMLTFSVAGLLVVLGKVLLAGVTLQIAGHEVGFGTIDGTVIAAILTPTLGAYVGRRYTDRKHGGDPLPGAEVVPGDQDDSTIPTPAGQ